MTRRDGVAGATFAPSVAASDPRPVGEGAGLLARLTETARRAETPCGGGALVWYSWGAGQPVVLLHGGSGSWRHWVRNIPALARNRLVLAPDLPGLGESAMPPPPHEPEALAAIVAEGLDALLGAGARYHLVGFSFGALIAGHVAAARDHDLRSLTLVGAGALGLPRNPVPLEKVRDRTGVARTEAHRANLASLMLADPASADALALAVQDWNSRHARMRSRHLAPGTSLRDTVARVRAPLNALYGERDAIAWPRVQARLDVLRAVRPDVTTSVIPDAGHWVSYEAADRFDAVLGGMLDATEGDA